MQCRNGQRPGAITGMTVEEFDEGMRTSDPSYLMIMVADHKSKKPAKIVASKQLLLDLIDWMHILRPLHVPHGCPYVFSTEKGGKVAHFSRSLTVLADEFDSSLPAATEVRKAIATKGGGLDTTKKTALANAMSHSVPTADRYYRAYGESTSVEGFQVIGSLLEVELVEPVESEAQKKRKRFTEEQTKLIREYFAPQIAAKEIPRPPDLEKFLSINRQHFLGRQRGDIYSKVRNIIGRQRK